ncbi:putative transcription factor [Corchorus olitorius]|uniref:Transcription factor n=1 Tax=Corchorus olitorius TaxID=93759 RepID=A0A1R3IYB6_9ROSI|nr:putative transcription factor [Corchorus olitorius]
MAASQPPHHQFSSSSSAQHPLQLRLYNGTPLPQTTDFLNANKGKASMSLDLHI